MGQWESWDIILWAGAAYLAITFLVRLMLRRRQQLFDEVRAQLEQERQRRLREERAKAQDEPPRGRRAA